MKDKVKVEKADMRSSWHGGSGYHRFLKRLKNRIERRRAKYNPECAPGYRFYSGMES